MDWPKKVRIADLSQGIFFLNVGTFAQLGTEERRVAALNGAAGANRHADPFMLPISSSSQQHVAAYRQPKAAVTIIRIDFRMGCSPFCCVRLSELCARLI